MFPPFSQANALSRLFFWWITQVIRAGLKRELNENDVFDVEKAWTPPDLVEKFWHLKQNRSTWKALWIAFRGDMLFSGFLYSISVSLRFVGPVLLNIIVTFISQYQAKRPTNITTATAFGMACLLCACQIVASLLSVHADFIAMRVGLNARDALIGSTFRHLALLSNTERAKINNGLVMSLVSNDAMVAVEFARFWNQSWTSPFVLVAGIVYIHILVGVSVWAGMSILVVFVPFSMFMAKAQTKFQKLKMVTTDQRVKLSSEALQGIRVVKFNAWESALEGVLSGVRKEEVQKLRYLEYVKALTTPISVAVPNVASVLTFITYVATGNALNPANTFSVISLFVIIRSPFVTFPIAIAQFSRAAVMSNRFDQFFNLSRNKELAMTLAEKERLEPQNDGTSSNLHNVVDKPDSLSALSFPELKANGKGMQSFESIMVGSSQVTNEYAIKVEPLSEFTWDETSTFRLKINSPINIRNGEFIAIVGSVGSGKTSLLLSLLGESHRVKGSVIRPGRVAYCSQEPFILNTTLRDNVLFGSDYKAERYVRAVRLACLADDVEKLPAADLCEIGERGVNLSGGQKARVALARALYSGADVLLLDDVLSAVDAHVGRTILEDCLMRMQNKTRVLVTNNLHVLEHVDRVIVLVDGVVQEVGPVKQLLTSGSGALVEIMKSMVTGEEEADTDQAKIDAVARKLNDVESAKGLIDIVTKGESAENEATTDSDIADTAPAESVGDSSASGRSQDRHITIISPRKFLSEKPMLLAQHSEPVMFGGTSLPPPPVLSGNSQLSPLAEDESDPFADENLDETEFRFLQKVLESQKSVGVSSKLTAVENRVKGKISSKVLKMYWLSGALNSYTVVVLLLLSFVVSEGVFLAVDAYLASAAQQPSLAVSTFLTIYASLTVGAIVGILLRSFCFTLFHLSAISVIYSKTSARILRFPMSFYWKEPLGRLLNRLSGDTNVMDTQLGSSWLWLLLTIVRVIGILCLIILAVPIFAVALIPIFVTYFYVREVYRRSATDLQRMEAVSKSPIMNILTETLSGTSTIRAYGRVANWILMADERLLNNTRAKFSVEALAVWLTLYLEFLGALVILVTGLIIVSARDSIGSGYAGLALAYSFNIVVNLNFSVKQAVMTEQQMSAVERLCEYADVPTEPFLDETSKPADIMPGPKQEAIVAAASSGSIQTNPKPPNDPHWPTRGEVVFEKVFLRYRDDLPYALNDLSFSVAAGESCGIVGKTGGGKSSLFVCLLRLVERSAGSITLDGVDVTSVSKRFLRSRVTIVPQDPVVFKGSLRYNLDPFNERSDAEIWDALRVSNIARVAEASEQKLEMPIADNGSNLSVGERALICMARAILRKSRIVCLDEASSALDSNTDVLIQKTIREQFNSSTLLIIAHRLDTVIDLDTVMVMGEGRVLEKDTPHVLLNRPNSAFSALVDETGLINASTLRERAAAVSKEKGERPSASV